MGQQLAPLAGGVYMSSAESIEVICREQKHPTARAMLGTILYNGLRTDVAPDVSGSIVGDSETIGVVTLTCSRQTVLVTLIFVTTSQM